LGVAKVALLGEVHDAVDVMSVNLERWLVNRS